MRFLVASALAMRPGAVPGVQTTLASMPSLCRSSKAAQPADLTPDCHACVFRCAIHHVGQRGGEALCRASSSRPGRGRE